MTIPCVLCQGATSDDELVRIEVWKNDLWRLTVARLAEIPGFSYLEPIRHISSITQLDGQEARTFGEVLAHVTHTLQQITRSERVYVYIFGDSVPHLHIHLAPHFAGDALNDQMVKGEVIMEPLPNGAQRITSKDYPLLPEEQQLEIIQRLKQQLA
ncbi:MAG: hypothetical protein H0U76_18880 [Ktedonobacteraceae bacterium]|nr:hypothetical protein [Ktedonobacteraceae bacterium]MBA3823683.1 hypothetical protein [Ktedonobacterales bacterium]